MKIYKGIVKSIGSGVYDRTNNTPHNVLSASQILMKDGSRIVGPIRISNHLSDVMLEGNEVELLIVKPLLFYPLTLASVRLVNTNEVFKSKDNIGVMAFAMVFLYFILSFPIGFFSLVYLGSFKLGFFATILISCGLAFNMMSRWKKHKNWFLYDNKLTVSVDS